MRDHQARWLNRTDLSHDDENEYRFWARLIENMLGIEADTIREFYFGPEDGESDIEKTVQEQPKVIEEEV